MHKIRITNESLVPPSITDVAAFYTNERMMKQYRLEGHLFDVERVVSTARARTPSFWTRSFSDRAKEFELTAQYHENAQRVRKFEYGEFYSQRGMKKARARKTKYELQNLDFDPMVMLTEHTDPAIVSFIEDVALLCIQLLRAKGNCDRVLALSVFIKLRTGTPLLYGVTRILSDVLHDVFNHQVQADE
jgi:hypothetical protein